MSRNVAGRGSKGRGEAHHKLRATFQPELEINENSGSCLCAWPLSCHMSFSSFFLIGEQSAFSSNYLYNTKVQMFDVAFLI